MLLWIKDRPTNIIILKMLVAEKKINQSQMYHYHFLVQMVLVQTEVHRKGMSLNEYLVLYFPPPIYLDNTAKYLVVPSPKHK